MWMIIIPLLAGCVLSYKWPSFASRLPVAAITNISLILLLMVMGARIGADPEVVSQIASLGIQAFVLAWATVIGSTLVLYLLQFGLARELAVKGADEDGEAVPTAGGSYGLTLMLLGSVLFGIILGLSFLPASALPLLADLTTWILGLLLLGIGLDLGGSTKAFAQLKTIGPRIVMIPAGIIVGSIAGGVVVAFVWGIMAWNEAAAVASGFGWYSLSSVLIGEMHSPWLGAIAFVANVFRELIAIIITPLLARWLGPVSALGPAGATAMDVMLPVIAKGAGREYVPLAFFSGATLSLAVAFFVNFFINI